MRKVLVLLSGGVDSATVLARVRSVEDTEPEALFVDYGQPAAKSEAQASRAVAEWYDVPYRTLQLEGLRTGAGEILGRNSFLVHSALMAFRGRAGLVTLGIHAGTGYRDCSPEFAELVERSFEFHTDGAIGFSAPLLTFSKLEVFRLAVDLAVPIELTHSCESGNEPCAQCLSCKDREAFVAGA